MLCIVSTYKLPSSILKHNAKILKIAILRVRNKFPLKKNQVQTVNCQFSYHFFGMKLKK